MLDPRMPPREECVIREVLDRHAAAQPDKTFVVFDDGEEWSYAHLRRTVRGCADGLRRLGVAQGDFVLVWLPNGKDCLRVMLALNYLGAVYVPINTGYRGGLMEHVIDNAGARLMIAAAPLVERLNGADTAELHDVVVLGGEADPVPGLELLPAGVLEGDPDALPEPERLIEPWDMFSIIYTSGTTGPSKGVLISQLQMWATFIPNDTTRMEHRGLVNLPMFHVGGAGPIWATLMRGGSFALVESFRTSEFWNMVRRFDVQHTILLGAMTPFLLKEPPSPQDRDHPLLRVSMIPLSDQHAEFTERFGVEVYTSFNMTETSSPLFVGPSPSARGTAGRPRAGVECRVVDENDCELPPGVTGELIVRADMPYALNGGYHKNPEATAKAWRNGWFHTGDGFRKDAEGNFYFVDRMKDAIRRRGENISSFEVEVEVLAHPDVNEAAAVAVPSDLGEDDVMVVVAPVAGREIDPAALLEFLRGRMAYFMVPRYIRVLPELPKTPSAKVMKTELRAEGAQGAWDREAAGIAVKGERFAN